jgi:hypothetical protein
MSRQSIGRSRVACVLCLSAAIITTGCDRPDRSPSLSTSDSAGVEIVVNTRDDLERVGKWHVGDSLGFNVHTGVERDALHDVRAIAQRADGRVAVIDGRDRVLIFAGDGTFLRQQGRRGDGPGEYRDLVAVWWVGDDSVAVLDQSHPWITILSEQGEFVRTQQLSRNPSSKESLGLMANERLLVASVRLQGSTPYQMQSHWTISSDGAVDSIGSYVSYESIVGRGTPLIVARSCAAAAGNGFYLGRATSYEIGYFSADQQLRRIIRWDGEALNVTDNDRERVLKAYEEREQQDHRAALREMLARRPDSTTKPAYTRFIVDRANNVWVEMWGPPFATEPSHWLIFTDQGRLVARAELPARFTPMVIGTSTVLGVVRDQVDVESIMLMSLRK